MALDATLGGSVANSYATVAAADAHAVNQWYGATWTALDTATKEQALIAATGGLESVPWNGDRCSPSVDDENLPQALSWPRSGVSCDGVAATCTLIPSSILKATYDLAYQLSQNPSALQPVPAAAAGPNTYVSSQKLGDLEISFAAYPNSSDDCSSCGDPAVIKAYPWLKDMLKCWSSLSSGSGRIALRVRS